MTLSSVRTKPSSRRLLAAAILTAAVFAAPGCVSQQPGVHEANPAHAVVAGAMTASELSNRKQSNVYGYGLQVAGDRARFFSCEAIDTCGDRAVEVSVPSLVATSVVGRARPLRADGTLAEETDVLRLTLAEDGATSRGGVAVDPHRGITVAAPRKP